ncbi:TetR/AcrR family transcriptional regulator [Maridesulfovibrio salexigens]|uniref:Transcriptional regulator, TetR family n=1 Tax=Maridesulfovibrio salexigens (strain ATCC 14822 / DSM 2638 / NCIMB 8403 / VKM B-1763) TaxID=526222 RepID=C6BZG8_MARSD|nr:TetR/AcrR family transcriptional regulator [Maridesulfovibrio salexigens]ACS80805.1 transcriptional regulator, TetR family [Maridesulfovibrio salexigens DSM 2638]
MTNIKGKRQSERSRKQIKEALQKLLRSKSYGEISVGEIVEQADVGRSTFYRHFKSKADVMVDLHGDMFAKIFEELHSPEDWLAGHSAKIICKMFDTHLNSQATKTSIAGNIGADLDYIMRGVVSLLGKSIQTGLEKTFANTSSSVPFPVTASSIAGIYGMTFMTWKGTFPEISGEELADHVQRLIGAVIRESVAE